jgi:hypothetical protein
MKLIKSITHAELVQGVINNRNMKIINFTFWNHFTFINILDYVNAYFIDGNYYEIDRVYISGEFINTDGEKFSSTFALNIEEIILIAEETSDIVWKSLEVII